MGKILCNYVKGTNNNPGQCSALESPSGTIYNSPSSAFTTFVHKCQITRWEKGRLVYSKAGANSLGVHVLHKFG